MDKKLIVDGLLDLGAVKLQPQDQFTWTSGIKSPIYCDNRLTIGNVKLRKAIASNLTELIKTQYSDVQLIGACATAGIPHGTSVADILDLDMIYFRSKPKGHGTNSTIEGHFTPGTKIVIVEDLISTGKSVVKAVQDAKAAGLEVIGVVSIFSYGLNKSTESLAAEGTNYTSLITVSDLLELSNLSTEDKTIVTDFITSLNG
ncbi:orotate phosphoribosyltransferase [Mollicutes bacterium LVI A0078]|nr:orotate phosphoribosyltransferase [Mollicutes bacterium LVI A0075]WOO91183.1 orotate phosphoribosyltransferase [Mollicutes bacterium LVI A0078]